MSEEEEEEEEAEKDEDKSKAKEQLVLKIAFGNTIHLFSMIIYQPEGLVIFVSINLSLGIK